MKNIGVFIGAQMPSDIRFKEAAINLADELVKHQCRLIYGGASVGLMGLLANRMLELKGEVIGVIPDNLFSEEITHTGLTKLHHVKSMRDRKALLAELSDAFIIFPGGLGTLEELFEIWNARKIQQHKKSIGILNIGGYFDFLFEFSDHAVAQGFLKKENVNYICTSDDPAKLLKDMKITR